MRILLQAGTNWELPCYHWNRVTTIENLLTSKNKQKEIALLKHMKMFRSHKDYNTLQQSPAGKSVLTAFWKYVDGNAIPLRRILQGHPKHPSVKTRSMFTPQAVSDILQTNTEIECDQLVQDAFAFEDESINQEAVALVDENTEQKS